MPFVALEFLFFSHTGWLWNTFSIMAPGLYLQSITIYLTLPPLPLCHKPFKLYFHSTIYLSLPGSGSCWFREDGSPAPGGRRGLGGRRALSWVEISLVPVAGGPVCLLFYDWASWCRFSVSPIYFKIAPLLGSCWYREDGWQPQITVGDVEPQGLGKCWGCWGCIEGPLSFIL